MEFKSLDVFKVAVWDYNVNVRANEDFVCNEKLRCKAKCEDPCKWFILCSWCKERKTYIVKSLEDKYTYSRNMNTKQANSK